MARTLNMKFIRYLNLFEKITKVRTQHCFSYNSIIVFLVAKEEMAKAIGESGKNIKKLSQILGKAKIMALPSGAEDLEKFILDLVYPVKFKSVEVKDNRIVISAGMQSRAALIGRNKTRLNEMKEILRQYFNAEDVRVA
jgi:NusA-like KH domain protein